MKLGDISDEQMQSLLDEGKEVSQLIKAFRSLRFENIPGERRGLGTSRSKEALNRLDAEEKAAARRQSGGR